MNIENIDDLFNLIDFCEANKIDEINFVQLTTVFGKYNSFNIARDRAAVLLKKSRQGLEEAP